MKRIRRKKKIKSKLNYFKERKKRKHKNKIYLKNFH